MKKYTVKTIVALQPCLPEYTEARVTELVGDGITAPKIAALDIPAEDKVWGLIGLLPEKQQRLFAADCAESVLHIYEAEHPNDSRVRDCIATVRAFAHGEATPKELDSARHGAWAAGYRAYGGARDAAWAAGYAAGKGVRDTWAAAAGRGQAVSMDEQILLLLEYHRDTTGADEWDRRPNDDIKTMTLEECEAIVGKPDRFGFDTWTYGFDCLFEVDDLEDRLNAARHAVAHHRLQQELEGEG